MKNRSRQLFISLVCILAIVQSLNAQEPTTSKPKQFIYVLKLVPRLYADSAWTKEDQAVLGCHFVRFQEAAKSGRLILAGRTSEPGDKTFGIAIFEAPDEDAASIRSQLRFNARIPRETGIDRATTDAELRSSQNARLRERYCRAVSELRG